MDLYKQLHVILTNSKSTYNIIQVAGDSRHDSSIFSQESDTETLEIGISKKTYLKIFRQSHLYWHEQLGGSSPTKERINEFDDEQLWSVYYMTLGFLITTNENHTLIKLHEEVFFKLYDQYGVEFFCNEFNVITSFVTSRLKRINKSSSLWFYIKKLLVMSVIGQFEGQKFPIVTYERLMRRILKSCDLHFANYYASNFLVWCIRFNSSYLHQYSNFDASNPTFQAFASLSKLVYDNVLSSCRQDLQDVSKWRVLHQIVIDHARLVTPCKHLQAGYDFAAQEFDQISSHLSSITGIEYVPLTSAKASSHQESIWPIDSVSEWTVHQLHWLLDVECSRLYPYESLLQIFNFLGTDKLVHSNIAAVIGSKLKSKKSLVHSIDGSSSQLIDNEADNIHCLESIVNRYLE